MKPHQYKPPSYLDPKEILTPQEESELHQEMTRFGANVFKHRVLIKPYFQDKVTRVFMIKSNHQNRIKLRVERLVSLDLDQFWMF